LDGESCLSQVVRRAGFVFAGMVNNSGAQAGKTPEFIGSIALYTGYSPGLCGE
jgi:hypothetical protein